MNSPLAYIAGKSKLAETIIKIIPEHQAYCEVFAGAAWVSNGILSLVKCETGHSGQALLGGPG